MFQLHYNIIYVYDRYIPIISYLYTREYVKYFLRVVIKKKKLYTHTIL